MNQPITQNQQFDTYDLGCAAALISENYKLNKIDKSNPKRALFCFSYELDIYKAVNDYFSSNFQVDALHYFNSIKTLKTLLYSDFQQAREMDSS